MPAVELRNRRIGRDVGVGARKEGADGKGGGRAEGATVEVDSLQRSYLRLPVQEFGERRGALGLTSCPRGSRWGSAGKQRATDARKARASHTPPTSSSSIVAIALGVLAATGRRLRGRSLATKQPNGQRGRHAVEHN